MAHTLRTTLFFLLLTTILMPPALARTVIGVTPFITPGVADPVVLNVFERELSSRLGDTVQVRSFGSEAAVLDWLIRFRELDAALVGPGPIRTLPAGTLLHLADLPQAVVVTHPGIAATRLEKLRLVFDGVLGDEHGRQLLDQLASAAKTPSPAQGSPAQRTAQSTPPAPSKPAKAATSSLKPAESVAPSPPKPAPALPIPQPSASLPSIKAPTPLTMATPPSKPLAALPPANKSQPAATAPAAPPSSPKRAPLLLATAVVVLIGISAKIALLMHRWRRKGLPPKALPQPPSAETFNYQGMFASPPSAGPDIVPFPPSAPPLAATPAMTVPAPARHPAPKRRTSSVKAGNDIFPPVGEGLIVERGRLGRIKVPALLKRCAELSQPVVLRVRVGDSEARVHFAAGQICHALSRNWRRDGNSQQWNKLGYLLVRDGLISETERDQALELIERQPGMPFSSALQQLGLLDLEALRHILARQAKATIYALILFSSGEYRIEADSGTVPAEESIALQVEPLIREASHHQAEWTAIRKALPNLGTLLDFTADGREKLEQVRLSVHQQLLLSQIDGQTSIGTLCSDSTMLDYEASRFLYLMVKAGVLQTVTAS